MRSILKHKKAQEGGSMIGLIVTIALILVAAILLISFFARGSGSFGDWLRNLVGSGSNVDSVISGCNSACTLSEGSSREAYCSNERGVKFNDKTSYKGSCYDIQGMAKIQNLGFVPCSKVDCTGMISVTCSSLGGYWNSTCDAALGFYDNSTLVKAEVDKSPDYAIWKTQTKCCVKADTSITCDSLNGQWAVGPDCPPNKLKLTDQVRNPVGRTDATPICCQK